MIEDRDDLPSNWSIEKIEEICTFNPKHDRSFSDDLEISFVPMSTVDEKTGTIKKHDSKLLGKVRKGYTHFADGDVIFAKITPCMENGKSAVARNLINGLACGSTEFHVLRNNGGVLPDYLLNFVRQASYLSIAAGEMTGVVGQRRLPKEFLLTTKIPLPPLNEQKRIVAKIEALQKRSQRVKKAIDAIPQLLDQFRQSVLAAAFRGDLTADWRENNPEVEPASVLLEKIRAERRRKWEEAELEKMKAKGKVPKDDKWKQKYKEPEAVDDSELPELPDGWEWTTVEQLGTFDEQTVLTGPFGATLGREDFVLEGVPVITIGCLQNRGLDLSKAMYISQIKADELERYKLKKGDFLFSRMASVGRAAIIEEELSGSIFNYHLMRLRLSDKLIKDNFFLYYVRGASAVSQYVKEVNHGATRDGINTQQLNKMPVALPPIEEQFQIIKIIEKYFDKSHRIDDFVLDSLEELQICNQSILAKAFRGELVPQNPNDEPASILLERIRVEREKLQQQTKTAKKSKGKTTKRRSKKAPQQPEEAIQLELPGMEEEG